MSPRTIGPHVRAVNVRAAGRALTLILAIITTTGYTTDALAQDDGGWADVEVKAKPRDEGAAVGAGKTPVPPGSAPVAPGSGGTSGPLPPSTFSTPVYRYWPRVAWLLPFNTRVVMASCIALLSYFVVPLLPFVILLQGKASPSRALAGSLCLGGLVAGSGAYFLLARITPADVVAGVVVHPLRDVNDLLVLFGFLGVFLAGALIAIVLGSGAKTHLPTMED